MTQTPGSQTAIGRAAVRPPTIGQRLLSPIAEVRPEEVMSVMLMTLLMLLILGAYYELKTAREAFILSEGGAEVKSYSSAGQAILLLFLVPAYGAFASRVDRVRLVQWVTVFFVIHIGIFLLALRGGFRIGVPYFLWVGIFNLMVIAQFWAFASDLYTPEQGKRLFPVIGIGASLGAWLGSVRAGDVMARLGAPRLLAGGAVILLVCVVLARVVNRVTPKKEVSALSSAEEAPLGRESGFSMVFADRYLFLIAMLMVVLNVVNTTGEYLFGRYVVEAAAALHGSGPDTAGAREAFIGVTYSSLFSTVNLVGFVLQMFVVSRVFKFLGVGKSLYVHPSIAMAGYVFMAVLPSLSAIRWLKVADNSVDYSLGNTSKQALWLPTSREAKYKAKQAVDSFFVRMGDVLQAALVFAGEQLTLSVQAFARVNIVLAAVWLGIVVLLNRQLGVQAARIGKSQL
jgi:AAA family ATP:ADP antiporter